MQNQYLFAIMTPAVSFLNGHWVSRQPKSRHVRAMGRFSIFSAPRAMNIAHNYIRHKKRQNSKDADDEVGVRGTTSMPPVTLAPLCPLLPLCPWVPSLPSSFLFLLLPLSRFSSLFHSNLFFVISRLLILFFLLLLLRSSASVPLFPFFIFFAFLLFPSLPLLPIYLLFTLPPFLFTLPL